MALNAEDPELDATGVACHVCVRGNWGHSHPVRDSFRAGRSINVFSCFLTDFQGFIADALHDRKWNQITDLFS